MRKIFTFFAAAALAMSAFATDYTGNITVEINGVGTAQETTINIVQNEDETYKLSINNFTLDNNGSPMGVGNIVLDNMKGYTINGVTTVVADQSITIAEGDDPNIAFWMGPLLGNVPIVLAAQFDGTKAKADIDIDMRSIMQQFIYVKFETPDYNGKYGDVNGDGIVSSNDVTELYNILLN
ncbi:MAG: calycin-like domain-containing protein [Muribaculaceae bacterium]|nr:calycin-like domain-containing protein [Muribaculaceae bacterium]